MNFGNYITVFNNIPKNFLYLVGDFIGFEFHTDKITGIIINILISFIFIVVYYLIGRKIRLFLFKNTNYINFNNFINVALGYIFVNSVLAILGLFPLLYPTILWSYIITVLLISIYPYGTLRDSIAELCHSISETKRILNKNKWVFFGVILFVFIAFLRLIPPEIGEDAIGYHTGDPHIFLKNHNTVTRSSSYIAFPVPHLGEMSYMLTEFIGFKDSARYIHFSFYFLVVSLLIIVNPYSALFFVTAPVVIQISSKANVDFQWILCWLLSILILTQGSLRRRGNIVLIGILFGGVLSSKLWTIAFFPLFVLYLLINYRKCKLKSKLSMIFLFLLFTFLVVLVWFWRAYIITGNPIFPGGGSDSINIIGFNELMFHMKNVIVFSPLFYLGIVFFLLGWRSVSKVVLKFNLSLFFVFLATEYLFVKYHFGRYLLGLYSLAVIIISQGLTSKYYIKSSFKIIFIVVFVIMFIYYFANTLLILPYGFGWADNNKYLTRILSRDDSSYYDFDHKFDKWISNEDVVATYRIYGFYYANFNYFEIDNIVYKDDKLFDFLLNKKATKLFIRGGDILWFCKSVNVSNCDSSRVKLLASYPEKAGKFYLYGILETDKIAIKQAFLYNR